MSKNLPSCCQIAIDSFELVPLRLATCSSWRITVVMYALLVVPSQYSTKTPLYIYRLTLSNQHWATPLSLTGILQKDLFSWRAHSLLEELQPKLQRKLNYRKTAHHQLLVLYRIHDPRMLLNPSSSADWYYLYRGPLAIILPDEKAAFLSNTINLQPNLSAATSVQRLARVAAAHSTFHLNRFSPIFLAP